MEKRHGQRKSKKLTVVEMYHMNGSICEGWKPANKEMTIGNIFLLLRSGAVLTVHVKNAEEHHGRDFNAETFYNKYSVEIIEELILRAEEQKQTQFKNFRNRRMALTSYSGIDSAEIEVYQQGIYFIIDAHCHTSLKFFMDNTGTIRRKPKGAQKICDKWEKINC